VDNNNTEPEQRDLETLSDQAPPKIGEICPKCGKGMMRPVYAKGVSPMRKESDGGSQERRALECDACGYQPSFVSLSPKGESVSISFSKTERYGRSSSLAEGRDPSIERTTTNGDSIEGYLQRVRIAS
jgi:hypothetical protein